MEKSEIKKLFQLKFTGEYNIFTIVKGFIPFEKIFLIQALDSWIIFVTSML